MRQDKEFIEYSSMAVAIARACHGREQNAALAALARTMLAIALTMDRPREALLTVTALMLKEVPPDDASDHRH